MASLATTRVSEEEYLRLERLAETKSEFHDGEIFAMSGGTFNHSALTARMVFLLGGRLPAGCRVCSADLRIKIAEYKLYTYPDCSVVCGEPEFAGNQRDCLLNPMLIVEVLSPSSEDYDRGKKFEMYRTIQSLGEYLVVHQDKIRVEHHSKQEDGSWVLRDYSDGGDSIVIRRIGVEISLADLYSVALFRDESVG